MQMEMKLLPKLNLEIALLKVKVEAAVPVVVMKE
jgi:hypothetical protein